MSNFKLRQVDKFIKGSKFQQIAIDVLTNKFKIQLTYKIKIHIR